MLRKLMLCYSSVNTKVCMVFIQWPWYTMTMSHTMSTVAMEAMNQPEFDDTTKSAKLLLKLQNPDFCLYLM